jgi:hypothetical protein
LSTSLFSSGNAAVGSMIAKPPICGLVTMSSVRFIHFGGLPTDALEEASAHANSYVAAVVYGVWSQIEPQPGVYDFSRIDRALDRIADYNRAHPQRPITAKLRVDSGVFAPDWMKAMDGGPITINDKRGAQTVGHFWTPSYQAAWRRLQAALAARYDGNLLVQEVAVTSCGTIDDESFNLPMDGASIAALHAAGYSDRAFAACLMGAIQDYTSWRRTPIDYTFNLFRATDSGQMRPDAGFAIKVMRAWRQTMGARGVIGQHSLESSPGTPPRQQLYDAIRSLGPPLEFQLAGPARDPPGAVAYGKTLNPTEIELFDSRDAGGPGAYSAADVSRWSTGFACQRR